MLAAQLTDASPLPEVGHLPIPRCPTSGVLLKVVASGVCHSDLHLAEGGYDLGSHGFVSLKDRGIQLPLVPGHEVVGQVIEVAPSVTNVSVGENVLVYPWMGCGHCDRCDRGQDHLCESPQSLGLFQDGGFAEYLSIWDSRYCLPIGELEPCQVAPLACCGLTAYSALKKVVEHNVKNLFVIGMGGLGLYSLRLATQFDFSSIEGMDPLESKRNAAVKIGVRAAHQVLPDPIEQAPDGILDFVNTPETAAWALKHLRKGGIWVPVGLFGGSLDIPLPPLPLRALTIKGSYTGSLQELQELLEIAKRNDLLAPIGRTYRLEEIHCAFEDLKNGRTVGRGVITMAH